MSSRQHHCASPSRLASLELCVRFDSEEQSEAADEGTDLHAATEKRDTKGLTDEQKTNVEKALTYSDNIKAGLTGAVSEYLEVKLELQDLTFGTADKVLYAIEMHELHVFDWKYGRKPVTPVQDNFQIQTYCAAALEKYPGVVRVVGHIVQPRLNFFDSWSWDRGLVPNVRQRIEVLYAKIADPFTPATPHDDVCGVCRWASKCPALGRVAVVVARGCGLPVPETFAPESLVSVDDRAKAHVIAMSLEKWCEQVKAGNTEFVLAGGVIPGYKMITRSTGSKIPAERTGEALQRIKDNGYAREVEVLPALTLSIPKLAEAMTVVRGNTKEEEQEHLKGFLGDIVVEGTCSYLQKSKAKPATRGQLE